MLISYELAMTGRDQCSQSVSLPAGLFEASGYGCSLSKEEDHPEQIVTESTSNLTDSRYGSTIPCHTGVVNSAPTSSNAYKLCLSLLHYPAPPRPTPTFRRVELKLDHLGLGTAYTSCQCFGLPA